MTKLAIKSDKIMPFGGIFPIIKKFSPLERLIDSELGIRSRLYGYQYGEIVRTMMCCYLCGGERMEDIKICQPGVEQMPGVRLCSPDTALRAIEELTTANVTYVSDKGAAYDFNPAEKLNALLLKCSVSQNHLRPGRRYILDYDNEFIEAEKYDARPTYKKFRGYSPDVSVLTDMVSDESYICGVENRDGNAGVKFHQADTLKRTYDRLEKEGLWATVTRCDCGSYSRDIIETVMLHCHRFYIRANMYAALREELANERREWRRVTVGDQDIEVLTMPFTSIKGIDHCRLVVQRAPKANGEEPDLFDGAWVYRAILTNDWDSDEEWIINFYNQRGAKEKVFDQCNNDFGWRYLPKSFMAQNSVFLVLMALVRNFYCGLLRDKAFKAMGLNARSRVKTFMSKYLAVPAKWTRQARGHVLNLYTERKGYEEIFRLGFG